jgi:hypothetical protein
MIVYKIDTREHADFYFFFVENTHNECIVLKKKHFKLMNQHFKFGLVSFKKKN